MAQQGFAFALLVPAAFVLASEPTGDTSAILNTPGLVAFWDFGEEARRVRESEG